MSETGGISLYYIFSAFLFPAIMTVFTVLMYMGYPKKRNSLFGYRTKRSMKSDESWALAHRECRKVFTFFAPALWAVSALALLFVPAARSENGIAVLVTVEALSIAIAIPIVEKKLKDAGF